MPWKPKTICRYPGCHTLSRHGYCIKHKKQINKQRNIDSAKLYTYEWRKASKAYLTKNPLCVHCYREGRLKVATEVDHIKPHQGDLKMFWDINNWQGLCKSCHSIKTSSEDGGFGNRRKNPRGSQS